MYKFAETPLDDHSRFLFTSVVHKHYSLAQLNFVIAKHSSFFLKEQYKYSAATTNISEKTIKAFPNNFPSLIILV